MAAEHAHSGEIPLESAESGAGRSGDARANHAAAPPTPTASTATSTSDRVAARTRESMQSLKLSSVGIELALSVVIGMFGGRWLDGKLGSSPWLMLVGIVIGFAAGLRSLIRTMDRASRSANASGDSKGPP
jgi:ATP synthase protein I